MAGHPLISFIIPTRNSGKHLPILLESMKEAVGLGMEIIICDNGSTDHTLEIAQNYDATIIRCTGKPPQVAKQRNVGARAAKGTYLYFLDHDMELCPDFIRLCKYDISSNPNTDAWYVPEKILSNDKILSIVRNFEAQYIDNTVVSAARLVKKTVYDRTSGYDDALSSGPADWDFDIQLRQLGSRFRTLNAYVVHHEEQLDIISYITKKTRYIAGEDVYKKKWFRNKVVYSSTIEKQYSLIYRVVGIFLEHDKWKKLLFSLHKYLLFLVIKTSMAAYYEYWRRRYGK